MDAEGRAWRESVESVVLPEWLQECLPEHKPVYTISWEETGDDTPFHVRHPDGELWNVYRTVSEAYDAVDKNQWDLVFDESVDGHGCEVSFLGVIVDDGNPLVRALISSTDADKVALLKSSYKTWLEEDYPAYQENPDRLPEAYSFISNHPAFWTRHDAEPTLHWETSGYMSSLWHGLTTDSDGQPVWMVEGGGHVEPDYTDHYHDLRLDAYGATFEEALVNFAALVDKFFDVDGTLKEGVEYEPSELELTLKERMEEVERSSAEWENRNTGDVDA